MPATNQDITHWEGDSAVITIPITDGEGAAIDLSGATARWWMGKSVLAAGDDVYVQKSTDMGGGIEIVQDTPTDIGSLNIVLDADDTEGIKAGTYYHEAEIVIGLTVSTVATGKFKIISTMVRNEA